MHNVLSIEWHVIAFLLHKTLYLIPPDISSLGTISKSGIISIKELLRICYIQKLFDAYIPEE